MHGRESNSQPVDHKSDAVTINQASFMSDKNLVDYI